MNKLNPDLIRIQASQLLMEAEIRKFEAAVILGDNRESDDARERAHAHLDQMLDSKASAYAGFFKNGERP